MTDKILKAKPDSSNTSCQDADYLTVDAAIEYDTEVAVTDSTRWSRFTRMDGPWSWILCVFLLTCCLVVYGCSSTYGILFPEILKELKSGKAIIALPGSLSLANSGLLGPITGRFYDRFGCTRAMLFGGLLSVIGLFVSSFAPNSAVLILTFGMIFGLGLSLVFLSCLLVIPQYFDKYAFQATSMVSVGPGAALLIMSPIVQRLYQGFGWRRTMMFMAGLSFSPCIVGLTMCVRKDDRKTPRYTEQNQSETQPATTKCNLNKLIHFSVFKNKVFVLTAIMVTITSLGHMMPFVHLAKYCEDVGIPSKRSSWIYFTIGLSSLFSRFLVGKFGNTGLMTLPHIYQLGACVLAVGNLLLPILKEFYLLIMYGIVYGVGEGLVYTSSMHMVMNSLPLQRRGAGYGIYTFFISLSYAVGPPFSGLVADLTGSYGYAFYTAGSLEIVGASLQFLARCIYKQKEEMSDNSQHSSDIELVIVERETVL